ncbi:VC0807 family protein [Streptomyces sp. URMC 127]|uniref:VC0807 family protein n=1 Tax=Streptomyces sp. URMC 127 TaxID=3423402 RepID=UPI003F1DA859
MNNTAITGQTPQTTYISQNAQTMQTMQTAQPAAYGAPATAVPAAPAASAVPAAPAVPRGRALWDSFAPLVVDAVLPMAAYYALSKGFGMSTVAALGWSSALPAARTVWGLAKDRRVNGLAALILVVNLVGLVLSGVSGDARLMLAKDSAVSSTIGLAVIVSAFVGQRPLMTTGLKPWVVKGDPARLAAWDRLSVREARFRRSERTFSLVWGTALLAECVARVVGAYTLPVDTMVWLGNVILGVAIVGAMLIAGGLAADPMEKMVDAETAAA